MNIETVKLLLDKYFEGETNLEEEALLSTYFNGENIDPQLKQYQPLFQFFKLEKEVKLSEKASNNLENVEKPVKRLNILRGGSQWLKAIAAMLILTIGGFILIKTLYKPKQIGLAESSRVKIYDEQDDPNLAFEEVQAALKLVSKKMKKGTNEAESGLKKVKKATDDMDKVIKLDK